MLNKNTFKLAPLSTALAACAILVSTHAVAANIEGRVTDSQNKVYFEGALVEIKETNQKAVTERDGSFRFRNLKDGEYTLTITYLGTEPTSHKVSVKDGKLVSRNFAISSSEEMEEVVVYGLGASQAASLNRQKNASNLKTIVSSDSVGQFPDQNVAEALQRLPGMFILRDQGEGRFVGIRGIDPNLNNLTINGANIPSPESGVRSVAMDVIPSELIEGLEVSKTVTPDMDADAIGGSIDVKSLSAFDREGRSYSATIQASYNELTEDTSPKLSGSFTDIFTLDGGAQLGVATAVSWFQRDFGSQNIETDGGWGDLEVEDFATGEDIEGFGPEEIEQRLYQITRERMGAALNLDLRTSETDKYYFRTLYSDFSDDEFRMRNEYKFEDGKVDADTWTNTSGTFYEAEMDRDTKDRLEEQQIISIVAGGENQLDQWLVEYSVGYSKSEEKEPGRIDADFKGEGIDIGYVANDKPLLSNSANAHDLSNFELDGFETTDGVTEDEEVSFKLDFSRDFVWNNNNGEFKFGGKYRSREKFYDADIVIYDGGFNDATADMFAGAVDEGRFGPYISRSAIRNYFNDNQANFDIEADETRLESDGASFDSSEDVLAAYAMVTLDIDQWQIVTGLRYEGTEFSSRGNKASEDFATEVWAVDKDYSHLLPSLNVRYDVSDKLVTRFAYTNTIARPNFGDSAAFQLIEDDDGELKAEAGNPTLDPYESTNFDLSIEYYPGQIGVMSAGLFYKDIDNFIVMTEVQDNGEWAGFEEVVQPVNGGSASITGLELAWTKDFDSGLLVATNATFTDADAEIPSQSDTIANVTLGYETDMFSTRLTMSHKSNAFMFEDNDSNVYEDDHNQLDLNIKYYIDEDSHVYFNAINITDEPYYVYHGNSQYNYQYETYGSTFELGFTYTAF